mmetsp:Transcript_12745/g.36706  ORF Transcript_12745/g.36706 Transcript_12745/m.36706 type:complete len:102 (+) Transcript_12745:116-421(+)
MTIFPRRINHIFSKGVQGIGSQMHYMCWFPRRQEILIHLRRIAICRFRFQPLVRQNNRLDQLRNGCVQYLQSFLDQLQSMFYCIWIHPVNTTNHFNATFLM